METIFTVEFLHFINYELFCKANGLEDIPSPVLGSVVEMYSQDAVPVKAGISSCSSLP